MTTTQTPTYAQKQNNIRPYYPPFGPANIEEAVNRLQESDAQYRAGNFYSCKETEKELEEETPWLKE